MFVCVFVGPPYYSQRAVFALPLSVFFHCTLYFKYYWQNTKKNHKNILCVCPIHNVQVGCTASYMIRTCILFHTLCYVGRSDHVTGTDFRLAALCLAVISMRMLMYAVAVACLLACSSP